MRRKDVFRRIYASDGPSRRVSAVPLGRLMNPSQLPDLATSPEQMVACAPFFAEQALRNGFSDIEIRAVVITSLNGRKPQLQIDPELDLLALDRRIWPQPGIFPLSEPLRTDVWNVPSGEWPGMLEIQLPEAQ
jgi:vitamin K-dependent gamma-carboxylase